MKNIYAPFILLISFSALFLSCSIDTSPELNANDPIVSKNIKDRISHNARGGDLLPANSNNPYDSAGRIHDELFEFYYASDSLPTTISEIASRVETIASTNPDFSTIKGVDYQTVSPSGIAYIITESSTDISQIINNSGMNLAAKTSLLNFVDSLLYLTNMETSSDALYNFVVDYEATILNNALLTENDKRIILTTSSIARYSTYRDAKRPKKNNDPDWDIFVGNIMGGTNGAIDGEAEALMKALVTGIVQNQ